MFKNKLIIIIIYTLICLPCSAKQTIFNVPSADITEKGHLFLQQEAQWTAWGEDAFFVGTTFAAYGIGHNVELDANLFNVGAPSTKNISLGVGFKAAIPVPWFKEKFPKRELKLTIGNDVLFGLEGNGFGDWVYVHLSGRIPKVNTRLTAGISYGTRQVFGIDQLAFIAGVEQPINEQWGLLADWYSGSEHWAGYLIVGANYNFPKNTTLYVGYQIPNSPKIGPSGFVIQLAKIF